MLRPDTRYITVRYSCSRFLPPWFAGAEAWRWATTKVGGPPMCHVGSIWLMSDIWVICKGCRCNSTSDIGFNWLLVPGFGAKSFPNSWKKIGTTRPIVRHETRLKLWSDMLPTSWECSDLWCFLLGFKHPAASSSIQQLASGLSNSGWARSSTKTRDTFCSRASQTWHCPSWRDGLWWIHKPFISGGYSCRL